MEREAAVRTGLIALPVVALLVMAPATVLAVTGLIILPGVVVARRLGTWDGWALAGMAVGVGVAMLAVAGTLWAATGFPVRPFAWLYIAAFAGLGVRQGVPRSVPEASWPAAAMGLVMAVSVVTRLGPAMGLHAPLFADPAVEGTLARLLLDAGMQGSWMPYAPIPINHQPGFAVVTAAVTGMTGRAIPAVVLDLSLLVHAAFPLAVYVLAVRWLDRWRAVLAATVAAVAAFPVLTFMVGMNAMNLAYVVVPAVTVLLLETTDRWTATRATVLLVASAGLVIVHPVAAVFVAVLVAPLLTVRWRDAWRPVLVAGAGAVATLPYFARALGGAGERAMVQWDLQAALILPGRTFHPVDVIEPLYTLFVNTTGGWYTPLRSVALWDIPVMAPVRTGIVVLLGVAVWRTWRERDRIGAVFVAWLAAFIMLGPVQAWLGIRFPLWQYVYPSRFKFLLALPVALLLARGLPRAPAMALWDRDVPVAALLVLLAAPVALGATVTAMDGFAADPVVTESDVAAMDWMDRNVDDGTVLNAVTDVEAGAFIGGAGQWIPAVTGTPVVYPATSITGNVSRLQDRLAVQAAVVSRNATWFAELASRYDVGYVYVSPHTMRSRMEIERYTRADVETVCGCNPVFESGDVAVYRITG